MNEPETRVAADITRLLKPRPKHARARTPKEDPPTRACSPGVEHALLARERVALAPTQACPSTQLTRRQAASVAPTRPPPASRGTAGGVARMDTQPVARRRLRRMPRGARRLVGIGAATLILLALSGFAALRLWGPRTQAPGRPTPRAASQQTLPSTGPRARNVPSPLPSAATAETSNAPAIQPEDAVAWLMRGDYEHAASAYRRLTADHPEDSAYALASAVLQRRLAERCHGLGSEDRSGGGCS